MLAPIVGERPLLLLRLVGNGFRGPDLTVGMRIAASHHGAPVFKNLYMIDKWKAAKISVLRRPHIDDTANIDGRHLCHRQIVTRRETDYATHTPFPQLQ